MGNQLTGIAPSQILPVEHYLTDVADYEFDTSLGSTRFFKVARARYKEGLTVVKVFVIHDPSLPLKTYRDQLEDIRVTLAGASNCLPFQRNTLSDKAALLFRQYVKDSLYDRISTRPFLSPIEKKWIAFQLLCALNQCHKLHVCHGDIKSENVMVTGWNWLLLADFASFKPTYLPEDNPADFSYFFDTSRRRTCYIAPERFVESSWKNADPSSQAGNIDLTTSEVKKGDLTPAMDIFSAGCVIAELFTEGSAPFDLSQLLAYRIGEYSPWKLLLNIEDSDIRELVRHMMSRDPAVRLTAEEYLIQQRGKAFPEYFYTFLKLHLQRFASQPILPADDRIARVKRDLPQVLKNLSVKSGQPEENASLVLLICLVTSSLRSLHYCNSKLTALEILLQLSQYVTADIILDRLIPYMLFLVLDAYPAVRAEAVRTITQCLANVKSVPISDANIFPEYILPQMSQLTQDNVVLVRAAYAQNIALLAETALRFLEIVQLSTTPDSQSMAESQEGSQYQASYDVELQALHEMIQQKVVTLLSDPDNIVKQTLLESGITRLCVFFGRQKANDVLLSHMITFLNDKHDWQLRGAFFDSIVGVAAYVGWQSSTILKPLLQQGLSDTEEFVIHKTLCALTSLTELGLLQKPVIHEMLAEVVPFLCHPGVWIRQGAVGFVAAVARTLNIADVHCNLLPLIQPFIKHTIIQVDQEVVLLNALQEPIPRSIYDYILRSSLIDKLFETLQDRQLIRNICRSGHKPNYSEVEDNLAQMFRKLISQGMTEIDEDKLLALKDFMLKLHRTRAGSTELSGQEDDDSGKQGVLNLATMGKVLTRRHADLIRPGDLKLEGQATPTKKAPTRKRTPGVDSPSASMNEDWKQMFGSTLDKQATTKQKQQQPSSQPSTPQAAPPIPQFTQGATQQPPQEGATGSQKAGTPPSGPSKETAKSDSSLVVSMSQLESTVEGVKTHKPLQVSLPEKPAVQARYSACKMELRNLVYKKRDQYANDQVTKDLLDSAAWDNRPPPPNWKPRGLLVAHLHEHRGAVNRIQVSHDHAYFATCSNDGTVKVWNCSRMEGKSVTNRSRQTYHKQGGQIKNIVFCESSYSLAAASDNGTIHVFRIETDTPRISILHQRTVDVEEEGLVVDMNHFDTGSQSVLTYATVHGCLIGWDLRAPKVAWKLKNDPKHGLITSFDIHHMQSWLSVGTSSGTHVCWDMRFQLPITTLIHPTGARVRRLLTHPSENSWIISAVQGNNEVSMWDMETGARHKTLWASTAPALSQTQASNHSVNGMYIGVTDSNTFLLTAGSDMRVRHWDLTYPANSHIVAGAASDPANQTVVSYRSRLIDGTEVVQETYGKSRGAANEDIPRRGPDLPPLGHHDVITDVNVCQTSQCFIITCSRDGVVKVWK